MTPSPDPTELEDLKASVPLLDLLASQGLVIDNRGKSYKTRCPFHKSLGTEKPSLLIWSKMGRWSCKTCGRGGDGLHFLKLQHPWKTHDQVVALLQQWREEEDRRMFGPSLVIVETLTDGSQRELVSRGGLAVL